MLLDTPFHQTSVSGTLRGIGTVRRSPHGHVLTYTTQAKHQATPAQRQNNRRWAAWAKDYARALAAPGETNHAYAHRRATIDRTNTAPTHARAWAILTTQRPLSPAACLYTSTYPRKLTP